MLLILCSRKFPLIVEVPSVSTMNPPKVESSTMLNTKLSFTLGFTTSGWLSVSVPLPSEATEYVDAGAAVKLNVLDDPPSFTSSIAIVMLPCPSA